jgi:hypothetical protein
MAQLVILGHKTRSKEVIEILEMLGGKVSIKLSGGASSIGYYINSIGNIDFKHYSYFDDAIQFTLEEFLEKFPYKVGDKVYNVVQNENQTITNLIWDPQENEIVYQTNYNEYVYVNYLQPYKEETKEKINVAKLLEGCPRGMELDCVMYEDCRFLNVDTEGNSYLIRITTPCGVKYLDKYGCYTTDDKAKCIIFPKGKMTWEGFVPPCKFKDGDILAYHISDEPTIFIHRNKPDERNYKTSFYVGIDSSGVFYIYNKYTSVALCSNHDTRLATEEEKQKLFDAIKANGYKWNAETKTLEKLVEPKFKVGDKVLWNYDTRKTNTISNVTLTENRGYVYWIDTEGCSSGWWGENELTPIPNKFDISTLIPFESRVLARYCKDSKWIPTFWGSYDKEDPENPYNCCGMLFAQCIPYEGNEYLLNTADDCDEYFKTWQ